MNKLSINKYVQLSSNVFAENKLLKICFVLMLGLTIVNCIQTRNANSREKTILIPPGAGYEFEISGYRANNVYYKQMARYLINLRGTIDASNAHVKFNELLMLVHPARYGALKEELLNTAKEYERYAAVSQNVVIQENIPIKVIDDNTMIVRVIKERIVGNEVTRKTEHDITIKFLMEYGRFWLTDIKEGAENA